MKSVFVDTSGFYAVLDALDIFHQKAVAGFEKAESERWQLVTTNYVVHETWALVQARLGWDALDGFLDVLLPQCQIKWVDQTLYALGEARCRQARSRYLSLTDCISIAWMKQHGITCAIAQDDHFRRERIVLP